MGRLVQHIAPDGTANADSDYRLPPETLAWLYENLIVTRDLDAARQFAARIDSSAVMINASTRLNDGGQFGLGAEIGISTDKFHARGPCGIHELTSYKYVVYGNGQVRE